MLEVDGGNQVEMVKVDVIYKKWIWDWYWEFVIILFCFVVCYNVILEVQVYIFSNEQELILFWVRNQVGQVVNGFFNVQRSFGLIVRILFRMC